MSEVEETVKAIQESAKTANTALKVSEKFGSFMFKIVINTTTENAIGFWTDKLKYRRWENQISLIEKSNKILKSKNLTNKIKPISFSMASQLIEKATFEDNDYLQELWALLLVNSITANDTLNLYKTYINILEQLSPLEAQVLLKIYQDDKISYDTVINTHKLPNKIVINGKDESSDNEPSEDMKLILENLLRLGCIGLTSLTIGGTQNFSAIHQTVLGKRLATSLK